MNKKQIIATTSAAALALTVGIGGTLAWLYDVTDPITNTFTVGNVTLSLAESKGEGEGNNKSFTVSPGTSVAKDPKVTVGAGSDDCYVFVKVDEVDNSNAISWNMRAGWTELEGAGVTDNTVWYQPVSKNEGAQEFYVLEGGDGDLANGKVDIANTVTGSLEGTSLTFTAYGIQQAGFNGDVLAAWNAVKDLK